MKNFSKNYCFTLSYEGKKLFIRGEEVEMTNFMSLPKNDCITLHKIKNVLKIFREHLKEVRILPLTS